MDDRTGELWVQHDLRQVWVLNRHRREEAATAATDVNEGRRTINEYRQLAGLETFDAAAADVLLIPGGKVVGTDNEDLRTSAAESPMMGVPSPANVGEEAQAGAAVGSLAGVREAEDIGNARSLRLVAGERRSEVEPEVLEGKQGSARADRRATGGGDWG